MVVTLALTLFILAGCLLLDHALGKRGK
jgi:hypothetical protein